MSCEGASEGVNTYSPPGLNSSHTTHPTLLLKYSCLQIFEQKRDCSKSKRVYKDFSVACMADIGKV